MVNRPLKDDPDTPIASRMESSDTQTRSSETCSLRLLVPVGETTQWNWGVRYALWKHELGISVEVALLHVLEPALPPWEVLAFRTEQQLAALRSAHASSLLEQAAIPFRRKRIRHQLFYREGEVVFEILDAAEQLDCSHIVVAKPVRGWQRLFSRGIVPRLLRRQRAVPIVTVNVNGLPYRA